MTRRDILIIDNDPQAQNRLDEMIRTLNDFQSITAPSGEEGLRLALAEQPALIILSLELPEVNGPEVLKALQKRNANTPVICATANVSAESVGRAFRLGACDCISKPYKLNEVERGVRRALDIAESRREEKELTRQLAEANQQLQRQLQELNAIHAIGRLSTSLLDLDTALNRLTEMAVYMTDAEESMLLLLNDEGETLHLQANKGPDGMAAHNLTIEVEGSAAGRAVETGRPVLLTGERAATSANYPVDAILYVPLRTPDRGAIGVLGIASLEAKDAFSEQDIFLLSSLVDYAAIAIENAQLFEDVSNAKALMDNVLTSINSGVLTINTEKQITLFNRAARNILRAPEAAAVGSSLAEVLPTLEEKLAPLIERVKTEEKPTGTLEIDLPSPAHKLLNLRVSLSPILDNSEAMQGIAIVIDDVTERRRLESRYQLFQRYLSPAVIERLPSNPYELKLGGQRREIACLFADLRGFMAFSLRHPPETLVEVLNQYLAVGANAILAEEGTLDKFMGDAIVAFFNAPLPQEDHALRAVRAALKIREEVKRLHERLTPPHQLAYGTGISLGDAIVGNIGTPQRLDYTAIGPSVNMARRLQEAATAGQVLLTPPAYRRIQEHVKVQPISLQRVKGLNEPFKAYEVLELR